MSLDSLPARPSAETGICGTLGSLSSHGRRIGKELTSDQVLSFSTDQVLSFSTGLYSFPHPDYAQPSLATP